MQVSCLLFSLWRVDAIVQQCAGKRAANIKDPQAGNKQENNN
jgi:hypothetical protein